jgi:hypothetical protein
MAALAGGCPAKNRATINAVATSARTTSKRLTRMFTFAAVIRPLPANSSRWNRATNQAVMISPTSATGPSAKANVV